MRLSQTIASALIVVASQSFAVNATADDPLRSFVEMHCVDCHSGAEAEAELDLMALPLELSEVATRQRWITVHDRVANGEMPPRDYDDIDATERAAFLDGVSGLLVEAVLAGQRKNGRGVVRRLNRVEYETALADILGLTLRIQQRLPADGRRHGFDTVGAGLNVSSVQMEAYLEVLDDVLDEATALHEKPARQTWKLDYRDTRGIMEEYRRTGPFHILPDGVVFFAPEKHAHLNAVLDHFTIPYSSTYRVKVSAYAIRSEEPIILTIRAGGPGHSESDEVPKTLLGHVTTRGGEPQVFEFETRLERGQFFRIYPASLPYMRFIPSLEQRQKDYQGPGVVVQWIEVDGPIIDQWPPKSHQLLWGGVNTQRIAAASPNPDPNLHLRRPPTDIAEPRLTRVAKEARNKETGRQWEYDPKQGVGGEPIYRRARIPDPLHPIMRLAPESPKSEAIRLLSRFLPIAYRRPVTDDEIQRFVRLVHGWLDGGDDFETAMRAGYKAILTSPGFLYHQASLPGEQVTLNSHALAERLSFFLWTGAPDDELRQLAAEGKLTNRTTLRQQVERMLSDPKSDRFVENFLGQWLDLRQLNFTSPDSDLYPEHDPVLQWSLAEETHQFFA